jgi:Xaa-Pro aminopeptidase
VKGRVERLTDLLAEEEIDVLLVTELVNVRYLTGYDGSNGIALIGPRTRAFATDFRYFEQAAVQVHPSFARARASLDLLESVTDLIPVGAVGLGFDDVHMSVRQHERLRELLPARVELLPAGGVVERIRAVKEPEEVKRIRTAAQLADASFERIIRDGLIGRTERDVAVALEHDMRERGARRPSFDSIIAAGPHGALPHAQPASSWSSTGGRSSTATALTARAPSPPGTRARKPERSMSSYSAPSSPASRTFAPGVSVATSTRSRGG